MEPAARDLDGRAIDELDGAVRAVSAASARVLRALSRCAEDGIWKEHAAPSMTSWLQSRYALTLATAREWVLISRALRELPRITESYERGDLTWDQVRPLARFATADDDEHWARVAPDLWPADLWREHERRRRVRVKDEREAHASRCLSLQWDPDRPVVYLEGRLGRDQGIALETALARRAQEVPWDGDADDPVQARAADALVEAVTGGGFGGEAASKDVVVVHVSAEVLARTAPRIGPWLAEVTSGRRLHPETIRRLACDATIEWHREEDGRPTGIGRQGRQVPSWLERAVRYRDGGRCRFQGCERKTRLLSHHIKHWADGGATDLDNLLTLCATHHRLIHEGGWRISGKAQVDLRFHDPAGRALRRAPPAPIAV